MQKSDIIIKIQKNFFEATVDIVLASTSPRRKELLEHIGLDFSLCKSSFKEISKTTLKPKKLALKNAIGKAKFALAKKGQIVIAADTIVVAKKEILGKPKDKDHAVQMLKKLSGKKHFVYTAVCVKKDDKIFSKVEKTTVKMRKLHDKEILEYVKTKEPLDKAGAYAIQGKGSLFVKRICGCYFNVVGLPLFCLLNLLKKVGVELEYQKYAAR